MAATMNTKSLMKPKGSDTFYHQRPILPEIKKNYGGRKLILESLGTPNAASAHFKTDRVIAGPKCSEQLFLL